MNLGIPSPSAQAQGSANTRELGEGQHIQGLELRVILGSSKKRGSWFVWDGHVWRWGEGCTALCPSVHSGARRTA